MDKRIQSTTFYSKWLLLLTTVHHIYGAYIYDTPWRMHVTFISLPTLGITLLLSYLLTHSRRNRSVLFIMYSIIVSIVTIALVGVFEGIYNHLVKNILFYSGVSESFLLELFPPPKYEMPNDFLFELTGVGQAILAFLLIRNFFGLIKASREEKSI